MELPNLKKQDLVDVILPATSCDKNELEKIKEFLIKTQLKSNVFCEEKTSIKELKNHEFAEINKLIRFEQFKKAVNNNSNMIWCAKGGYGSIEVLPLLKKIKKPKKPKLFIGFSDITIFNKLLIEKWGWKVVIAPMLAQIINQKVEKNSIDETLKLIFGESKFLTYQLKTLFIGKNAEIEAEICGGCLSVLASQFGTKDELNWNEKILFLEDEGETGERLDRYFSHLLQIICEKKKYPKAILLGNFLQENNHGSPKIKNVEIAIEKFAKKIEDSGLKIALFQEISGVLGHSRNMKPLVLGLKSTIKNNILQQNL